MKIGKINTLHALDRLCFFISTTVLVGIGIWSVVGRSFDLTLPTWSAKWGLPVLTAAAVGYLTNALAIALLFRPYRPVKCLRGLQGIIPRQQGDLAKRLGEEIPASLLPPDKLAEQISNKVGEYLSDPSLADSIRQRACYYVKHRKEQIAAQLAPYLAGVVRTGLDRFFTPEQVRSLYGEYGSELIRKQIVGSELTRTVLAELQSRTSEISTAIRRVVRNGAEDYVRDEYPQLSNWIHADRFAAQMVMNLNWELIQGKIAEALTSSSARGMVRGELSALEEKLRTYVFSKDMASDLAQLKRTYMDKVVSSCEKALNEKLSVWLEEALSREEVWQTLQDEILPTVRGFLLHQIKRNRDALADGLDLSGRIEKAILEQRPEDIHALVNRVSGEHLVALQLLGFLLGGTAGLLLSFAQ